MPYSISKTKYCDFFKNDKTFYDGLLEVSDLPAKGVCPWPKGTYTIYGSVISVSVIPPYYSGDFMIEAIIKYKNDVVNGYQILVSILNVS